MAKTKWRWKGKFGADVPPSASSFYRSAFCYNDGHFFFLLSNPSSYTLKSSTTSIHKRKKINLRNKKSHFFFYFLCCWNDREKSRAKLSTTESHCCRCLEDSLFLFFFFFPFCFCFSLFNVKCFRTKKIKKETSSIGLFIKTSKEHGAASRNDTFRFIIEL